MDLELRSKVALVVGASEGMGKASARAIGCEGAHVVIVARNERRLEEAAADLAASGCSVEPRAADAENEASIVALVHDVAERHGRIDVLVNAVGGFDTRPSILDYDDASWRFHFDSVLLSAVRTCRHVIPVMLRAGGGAIVNVAAQSSERHWAVIAAYSAMKSALVHVTKNLAREFGASGIRVNAVRPGWILSESQRRAVDERKPAGMSDDDFFASILVDWPELCWARRFGTLEEVADVVAFLASERARYMNGAVVAIDGGSPV